MYVVNNIRSIELNERLFTKMSYVLNQFLFFSISRGKFASVRKIRHLVSGEEYAAKFIRKRRRAADTTREIQHEVAVLALCAESSRVVRLHEVGWVFVAITYVGPSKCLKFTV